MRQERITIQILLLSLGERVIGENLALDIVDIWLNTPFEGGRHQRRIDMIE